jgi:hypothetical protein
MSEDFGAMILSSTRLEYDWFCSSFTCAGQSDKVLIMTTHETQGNCPHCKQLLFSKRAKKK